MPGEYCPKASFNFTTSTTILTNFCDYYAESSHVLLSVAKLMSRIVAPDAVYEEQTEEGRIQLLLHDHTYGITSDPLTQFAALFAALIHDGKFVLDVRPKVYFIFKLSSQQFFLFHFMLVDHPGVTNAQLVKENSPVSHAYNGKSVLEQNSIDIAWTLLNEDTFSALRNAICETQAEMIRFRQLVVNAVMATDVLDKDLKWLRNQRWERAFAETAVYPASRDTVNRKATIVIEHLIQASDVAHTMQHWHIYRKWNGNLFEEMYNAYRAGRAEKSPALYWYEGELGFFDFYILPLAKKLRDCGVFGVSSDEYLGYAEKNREEWELRGRQVVESMVDKLRQKYPEEPSSSAEGEKLSRSE